VKYTLSMLQIDYNYRQLKLSNVTYSNIMEAKDR